MPALPTPRDEAPWWRGLSPAAIALIAALVLAAIALVALSLRREPPLSYAPTPTTPAEVGPVTVGPIRVTLDATRGDRWVFFDFSRGAAIPDPAPEGWDIAFRRFNIAINGGDGFAGRGGALDLGDVALDSTPAFPDSGYTPSIASRDSANPAIDRWYDYGFTSHLLTPRPTVYAIRTADGRHALLRFLSYYCPGAEPGCITFEYFYRGGSG